MNVLIRRNRCYPASVLGNSDPKSGQAQIIINQWLHLKSCCSRTYAVGLRWHAVWLSDPDSHGESPVRPSAAAPTLTVWRFLMPA
jgi:hypothetical protein